MKCAEVMKQLKSFGSEQTRKTYGRHGIGGPMFGVKYGDLNKLAKQLNTLDRKGGFAGSTGAHELAMELWDSGNLDARVLATMIVDPSRMTMTSLNRWMKDVDNNGLSNALLNVAQRSPVAVKMVEKWKARKADQVAATAWMMVAGISRELPETYTRKQYKEFLAEIEAGIHAAPNRVRYAMNVAVIGIGSFIDERSAVASAKRIGVVEVDHGDTSCKTPSAEPYIRKAAAKHREKLAKIKAKARS
jgi:3-methyladenine DNA glycosylase AlkD